MQKIELVGPAKCSGCEACVSICPTHSILMKEDKEGFLQPSINTKTCIKCHKCERTCPIVNLGNKEESYETKAYAANNLDEVKHSLVNGDSIQLRGFGTFSNKLRNGRKTSRNPKTGEKITEPSSPHYIAVFRAGKELSEDLYNLKIDRHEK